MIPKERISENSRPHAHEDGVCYNFCPIILDVNKEFGQLYDADLIRLWDYVPK